MSTRETISILKECDAGVKMALASLDDVWEHVQQPELRAVLNTTRAQHQLVSREVQALLQEFGGKEKDPNPLARSMSAMKANVKLGLDKSDSAVATLLLDNMKDLAYSSVGSKNFFLFADGCVKVSSAGDGKYEVVTQFDRDTTQLNCASCLTP